MNNFTVNFLDGGWESDVCLATRRKYCLNLSPQSALAREERTDWKVTVCGRKQTQLSDRCWQSIHVRQRTYIK